MYVKSKFWWTQKPAEHTGRGLCKKNLTMKRVNPIYGREENIWSEKYYN